MRILSVNLPPTEAVNLGTIHMEGLGATVVLAGRNGAGKTRLLRQLIQWASQYVKLSVLDQQIAQYKRMLLTTHTNNPTVENEIRVLETRRKLMSAVSLTEGSKPVIVPFVPTKLDLTDPNSMTLTSILQAATQVEFPGIGHLPKGTFARIQLLQDRKREATYPDSTIPEDEAAKAVAEYGNLATLITRFLNTPITRSINREAQLFGLPLGKTELSDGQKVIVQLCIAIDAQGANLNDLIIFMDVPENHLHPSALLDLVQAVQARLGNGQLWIATHSIPLLANVDPSTIWWMEDNTVSKAGTNPQKVLKGLLGEEERSGKLANFLDLPFVLASNRYAAECLLPPKSVTHATGDPQTRQARTILEQLRAGATTFRVLDFGAGKGRLASELAEGWSHAEREGLEFIAFDPSQVDAQECQAAISRLCGSSDGRLFHDATALRAKYDEGTFQVVVMCNVLHEILPDDWGDLFGVEGKITRLLRPDGYLLLVEVQQLPYGERPHQKGFLVMDTAQLRKLFLIKECDNAHFAVDTQRDGWLKAHLVARPLLTRFTSESKREALVDLSSTARDQIRKLLREKADYRQGRSYGFWVQQFAHAELALRQC